MPSMSSTINSSSLPKPVKDYYNAIPDGSLHAMARSFVVSFVASTVLSGGNVGLGAFAGSLAATASGIQSLTTPIFKKLFQNHGNLSWGVAMVRTGVAIIGSALLAGAVGYPGVMNILPHAIVINGLLHLFMQSNVDQPSDYWCIFV